MLKKFPLDKIYFRKKKHSFFFCELRLITALLLILNFYASWSTRFVSPKLCIGFSIFDSASFLLNVNFIFLFIKKHTCHLLTSFKITNNIAISNTNVSSKQKVKLLGINLESKLNFDYHVNTLLKQIKDTML